MKKILSFTLAIMFALNSYAQILGELNPNFGTNGSFLFDPSVAHDKMEKMLVQKDGKILTIGGARVGGDNYSVYVSRHNVDGTLDSTYGENGIAYFKANPLIYMNYAFDAALNEDGLLFVTGYTFDYINNSAFIICLDENGFENTEFGDNGYAVSEYGNGIVYDAIDIDSQGRPIVAGYSDDQILIRRYNTNGELDKTFGEDGSCIIVLDSTQYAYCYAYDIKVLNNDKILVAGHKVSADMIYTSYLLRLKSNGTFDTNFADNGVLYLNAGDYAEYAVSINVQTDGKYLVGGHADLPPGASNLIRSEAYITRVKINGRIDKKFGTEGFVRFEPFEGDGCTNTSYSILATQDEQIFGTIYSYNALTTASRAYIYNLDINGQLKEDFAGSGIMALPKIDENEVAITTKSLALQDNKNLLVGGYVALDYSNDLEIFISCINVDIKDENPEQPEEEEEENPENPENPGESIEELSSSLHLYPNHVNDRLYIVTETEIEEVVIYTITGVIAGQQSMVNGPQSMSMDVANLNSGVYFVMIKTNKGVVIRRFIKQ